ncbi:iron uptake system protein EfeO [Kingella kingae]|uniref:iron uptake system protein EfeO n=1 Tax=Kingella kingae TaxID=504 RepID=UPI0002584ADD|nr:iron uptake system protein EfeO [Kingella kingae]EIC14226.1 inactive ferrous ion transporter periplasmic protein EfeO [Kingella kingae PYKK081]MDK4569138.1 iron uptake system protein EfeO [Kingella kingae]MDK4571101.1 iron uptake system protein EfeO [Kingella kingae]MDK4573079.1 iron uptake system protein EfeO [Kingella kingae]MDK4599133.1 iron uptake system protein EfeO [Kingella kingae]
MKKMALNSLAIATLLALTACQPPAADKPAEPAQPASGAASGATAATGGAVQVAVNDTACEPMELTVPSGQVEFQIQNNSSRKLEWEILNGVMVVDERENIAPGLRDKMTVTLLPGEYAMTCGLLNNPRGKLVVTDSGFKQAGGEADLAKLAEPLAAYKKYVQAEAVELVSKTEAFVAAIKAGKQDEAKAMFADVRTHYERIEPIAELFNELDPAIDAREDDFKQGPKDPEFTGFHRLEYALWVEKSVADVGAIADRLQDDVRKLKAEIDVLNFPPSKVVGGAAVLIEEVAGSKISGEEDRYSHTDLSDFQANMDGAQKIVDLFRPQIAEKNQALLDKVDANLKQVNEVLAKYRNGKGFQTYDKLSDADRKALQAPINTLAEDLAQLRGTLGLK